MLYKTILVHCDGGRSVGSRVDVAVGLAERYQAHLIGLHARPPFTPPPFTEGSHAMDLFFRGHEDALQASEAAASGAFAKSIKARAITSEWRSVAGRADDSLILQARYADLVVVGQRDPEASGLPSPADLPESVALATGRGTLVVPCVGVRQTPGGKMLLCWNASREAARAAMEALPLLKAAGQVTVLIVQSRNSASRRGAEPGADVATWLGRHGIKATLQRDVAGDADVGDLILSRAMDQGSDLIVMGVFGHSRLREMVLGGASRTVLASMTVPVMMAH